VKTVLLVKAVIPDPAREIVLRMKKDIGPEQVELA
jgi:hypothetical protein